jgi:uncharacterized DUF497 family protein
MDILPAPLSFEWGNGNLPKNLHKHDVTYQEAEEIFSNRPLVATRDIEHSTPEGRRYWAFGRTRSNRRLFAAFTIRNDKVRIISIRDMTETEEDTYEEFEKDS